MKALNTRYRGVTKITDVLSFPQSGKGSPDADGVLGDIVICIPQALRQAREYGIAFHSELLRLLVHGVLHLAGYDHEINALEKKKMERKEREILNALSSVA